MSSGGQKCTGEGSSSPPRMLISSFPNSFSPSSATPKSPELVIPHLTLFSASWKPFPCPVPGNAPAEVLPELSPGLPLWGQWGHQALPGQPQQLRLLVRVDPDCWRKNPDFWGKRREQSVNLFCPTEPPSSAEAVGTLGNPQCRTKLPQASSRVLCDTAR